MPTKRLTWSLGYRQPAIFTFMGVAHCMLPGAKQLKIAARAAKKNYENDFERVHLSR